MDLKEMTKTQIFFSRIKTRLVQFRRKYIPFLVWYGEQVDVVVTWHENKLQDGLSIDQALKQLQTGHIAKIEQMIGEIGIGFDKGLGFEGRDWEWDWSLNGPISVKFRRPCKTQEKRS